MREVARLVDEFFFMLPRLTMYKVGPPIKNKCSMGKEKVRLDCRSSRWPGFLPWGETVCELFDGVGHNHEKKRELAEKFLVLPAMLQDVFFIVKLPGVSAGCKRHVPVLSCVIRISDRATIVHQVPTGTSFVGINLIKVYLSFINELLDEPTEDIVKLHQIEV